MKLLRRIKIGVRLYIVFGTLILAFAYIAYSNVTSRLSQTRDIELMKKNYIDNLEMLAEVNITTGNLFLSYRNYYLEYPNEQKMQVRLNDIHNRTDFILTNLQDYYTSLQDRKVSGAEIDAVAAAIKKIQNEVVPFNNKIISLMQSEALDDVHSLIISAELRDLRSTLQDDLITAIYNDCVKSIITTLDGNISEMQASNTRIIIEVAVGFVIILAASAFIVRSLVVPVGRLVSASRDIAAGKIDVNLPESANDEIGELTAQFGNVASVIKSLTSTLADMTSAHQQGSTDSRIDENIFDGAYKNVVIGINNMVGSYVGHMRDICFVLKEFGDGDFNAPYKPLPGKKAQLNDVVEQLRNHLKNIGGEIASLSKAAVDGRLSVRANPDNFKGDWKKLLIGLNGVMDAIITPVNEASDVLISISEGKLNTEIRGEYKGDFAIIKKSLSSMQATISSYITEISDILGEMSRQNLNVAIDRQYVGDFSLIKDSINMILRTFSQLIADFNSSAAQVSIGSKEISQTSYNLSQGVTEQASAVEELYATIDQISMQTDKNANAANKVNALAMNVKNHVGSEAEMMRETLVAMEAINESAMHISKIIKVIEDISFQTNLLALNAAVEASRAGEYGVGFAVVAEEVRNLAARSQTAAKETTALIEGSVQKASEGAKIADKTAKGLDAIVGEVTEITGFINEIALASDEQRESFSQISEGIAQIAKVTQDNTSISEESAALAEELSSQAEVFNNTLSRFKLQ